MFQIQEILLTVEIIKQIHAQNVLKEMEQVGVMATVCGRVVAVQQQVNFFSLENVHILSFNYIVFLKNKNILLLLQLKSATPKVELGDDMIIPLDTDLDDDWIKTVGS